jgi:hypothetical protein
MRRETLICDKCDRPVPALFVVTTLVPTQRSEELCGPCLLARVSDATRAGLESVTLELAQPAVAAPVARMRARGRG